MVDAGGQIERAELYRFKLHEEMAAAAAQISVPLTEKQTQKLAQLISDVHEKHLNRYSNAEAEKQGVAEFKADVSEGYRQSQRMKAS